MKASATRAVIGSTVDEPEMSTVPVSGAAVVVAVVLVPAAVVVVAAAVVVVAVSSSPQATATSAMTSKQGDETPGLADHVVRSSWLVFEAGPGKPHSDGPQGTKRPVTGPRSPV